MRVLRARVCDRVRARVRARHPCVVKCRRRQRPMMPSSTIHPSRPGQTTIHTITIDDAYRIKYKKKRTTARHPSLRARTPPDDTRKQRRRVKRHRGTARNANRRFSHAECPTPYTTPQTPHQHPSIVPPIHTIHHMIPIHSPKWCTPDPTPSIVIASSSIVPLYLGTKTCMRHTHLVTIGQTHQSGEVSVRGFIVECNANSRRIPRRVCSPDAVQPASRARSHERYIYA